MFSFIGVAVVLVSLHSIRDPNQDTGREEKEGPPRGAHQWGDPPKILRLALQNGEATTWDDHNCAQRCSGVSSQCCMQAEELKRQEGQKTDNYLNHR